MCGGDSWITWQESSWKAKKKNPKKPQYSTKDNVIIHMGVINCQKNKDIWQLGINNVL